MLTIVLRFLHVVAGALWVGMMTFTVFFLGPAMADSGPEGGKIMGALQRRGLMIVMPLIALTTILSGGWLLGRVWGNPSASRTGMAFAIGGAAALLAFLVGLIVVRPAMEGAIAATDPAQAQRLRVRGAVAGRVVALLLFFALGAMAVARYL